MRKGIVRRTGRIAAATAVIFVAAAGVAYATGASLTSSGSVQACANETNGNLRAVSDASQCRRHEESLSWSVVGPQGAVGPTGAQGPVGPTGPRGPSEAWETYRFESTVAVDGSTDEIARIPALPAGKYVVTGKVNVDNALGGSGAVDCSIVFGGWYDLGISDIGTAGGQVTRATIAATFGASVAEGTPAVMTCRRINGSGNLRASLGEIVVTKVESLTQNTSG